MNFLLPLPRGTVERTMTHRLILMTLALMVSPLVMHPGGGAAYACPPGLAKKDPPCVPPGQARKRGGGGGDHDHGGDNAADDVYLVDRRDIVFIDDYPQYDLPALPDGQRYALIDGEIVVIDEESYEILQIIQLFTALAD
jgi:hypothetical protein